jgi:uncharacterized protein YbjT (DUF2867 family)
MPKPITVVVAGATGRQGGAVARLLLDSGHQVRALTRRPGSQAAATLHLAGADIFEADFDDAASVQRAAEGADAFFLMATPFEEGIEAEARHGRRAARAAKDARVKHLVYSSVAGADRKTRIPHFDSKREVEEFLEGLGVPYTIVAPVFFMESLLGPMSLQRLRTGTLSLPLPPTRELQMIAVADIARFVRLVLERPSEFHGKRIDIASDSLTGTEMAKVLTQAAGRAISNSEAPLARVRAQSEDLARMWEWFDQVGYDTDISALRQDYPEVGWHDFRQWAREQDWTVLDEPSPEQPTV